MASDPIAAPSTFRFGDDLELNVRAYELRSAGIPLRLKPVAMELLLLLMERRGELVTREQIVERIWGKGVFVDTDNSINGAISKIRQVLRDDAEEPRFVQTVSGKGYRFVAPVTEVSPAPPNATEISGAFRQKLWTTLVPAFDRVSGKKVGEVETRATNLPVQRTRFVGREKEVAAAKELLLRQDVRLVTVTGPGGIGKTGLAVQVASDVVEHFPGGTHFIPLASLKDSGLIAPVIVQTLGIREAGTRSSLEILKENLQESSRKPMLLLLDNFEQLIQAAPIVSELLATSPNLKILVTSRAALHVYGEHEFPVPPLALPDPRWVSRPEILSQCPAVALFVQRAA
ncbi:MAG TPA: winged helix-turn-helix domain-containing protein, partial [Terriglobales bacterium]|nr:winged helix-turn-helix domain-containing protein [Terriglobales bacterium]